MRRHWTAMAVGGWMAVGVMGNSVALDAQSRPAPDGGLTHSLGQPRSWLASAGVAAGARTRDGTADALGEVRAGLYREFVNRALGVGGVQLEAYGGNEGTGLDGGVRARLVSPFARVGVGADYNVGEQRMRPIFTLLHPGRRGGLFGDGTLLRLDVATGSRRSFTLGIEKPVARRIPQGATRPARDHVRLSSRRSRSEPLPALPALREALAQARGAALAVQRLAVPWVDHRGAGDRASDLAVEQRLRALQQVAAGVAGDPAHGPPLERATRQLHMAVERAFLLALAHADSTAPARLGDDRLQALARAMATEARERLLEDVILPYDRLLGQAKDDDTTRPFAEVARSAFQRWLHVRSGAPRPLAPVGAAVFAAVLDLVEGVRAAAHADAGGSRFAWLPLQLALFPEQHDTQAELDALVARATTEPFTDGNFVSWVINEQFQYQLSRTIRAARDYHVLWTHDVRGVDARGDPDEMAFRHVMRSYLAALTERARAYDRTGTFPTYLIILDEWFYEVNVGRRWMSLLEDPMRHRVSLPPRFAAWEDSLAAAQAALRAAVDSSALLTAQRRQFGEGWLRNLVKVHVNITNVADPTFWSWRVASNFPMPDNWMRDHRKLAFYDLSDEDPYRGEALFTGAGVGEHYANLAWEDRSLLMRGPALLTLKEQARQLLLGQGIAPGRIPLALQPRRIAPRYQQLVDAAAGRDQRPSRAAVLHNEAGYGDKRVNVAKAVLYTLMPPGSVIKIPDSLWNGTFWGSALVGCALRGVRVLVIAPALANAPARAFGSMARSRELLWRLATASRLLAPEIAAAGGLLKVGLFASELQVTDIPGKVLAVRYTLERHAWLRELFGFPSSVYPGLEELARLLGGLSMAPPPSPAERLPDFESPGRSLLHLKANYFASREAWTIMARHEWVDLTWEFVQQRIAQVQSRSAAVASFAEYPDALLDVGSGMVQRWRDALTPAERERVIFFTLVGSQNQNERSMVTDGEDAVLLSDWPAIIPYLDLIAIVGQSRWIDDPAEVDALLPRQSALKVRLAHWFKLAF